MKIEIRASAGEFSRYQKLVDSDWNGRTFHDVLRLLWDVVSIPSNSEGEQADWIETLKQTLGTTVVPVPQNVENILVILTSFFRNPHIPRKWSEPSAKKSKRAIEAEVTIVSLLLQAFCTVSGETGFFRDLQSLLYLNAVHFLLPDLGKRGLIKPYGNLVNALASHCVLIWWDEPSHMFYLRAAMLGELGQQKERAECLRNALAATPVSDHSYMTKANAYWGQLLDLGENEKAMRWLVGLSRNVPESYAAEIAEMITETAGAAVHQN